MDDKDLLRQVTGLPKANPPAGAKERVWRRMNEAPQSVPHVGFLAVGMPIAAVAVAVVWFGGDRIMEKFGWDWIHVGQQGEMVGDANDFLAVAEPESKLRVKRKGKSVSVEVASGKAHFWAGKRTEDSALKVVLPQSTVRVVGTVFAVVVEGSAEGVRVIEGKVQIYREGKLITTLEHDQAVAFGDIPPPDIPEEITSALDRARDGMSPDLEHLFAPK